MWVKLLSQQQIDVNGTPTRYYPGDWVNVGRQTALYWIGQKLAEKPGYDLTSDLIDYTAGVLCVGDKIGVNSEKQITETIQHIDISFSDTPKLPYSETLIYYPKKTKLRPELIHVGFYHLENWQVIIPIFDYVTLAKDIGNEKDQELLNKILPETRIPVYNPYLMYVRRCDDTLTLMDKYKEYSEQFTDDRLSFLAAMYETKPLLLAVPDNWGK